MPSYLTFVSILWIVCYLQIVCRLFVTSLYFSYMTFLQHHEVNEASRYQTAYHVDSSPLGFCSVSVPCVQKLLTLLIALNQKASLYVKNNLNAMGRSGKEQRNLLRCWVLSRRKAMAKSRKKFLVDGSHIRVIRRWVEHFCIEKEIVPKLNKFLSTVKEKIYIFFLVQAICSTE